MTAHLLTLNAGSSSIKLGLFPVAGGGMLASGQVDAIGGAARLWLKDAQGAPIATPPLPAGACPDHVTALEALLAALAGAFPGLEVAAVGHRVVHGGPDLADPAVIDAGVLSRLEALVPFAPLHQPHNLSGVRASIAAFPDALQVACFDTAFHRHHPFEADAFALPRAYYDKGIRRYGFHGLSYDHIAGTLARIDPDLAAGRVIVAHLGNGASMCGLRAGRSIASTMGFTALDGLPMGTRCGQIDPGVLLYLMQQEGMDGAAISDLLYRQSGLLGLSGLSNDMRTLEASDRPEARQAVACFAYRIQREAGSLAAALGGLDGIVFTAGIGENSVQTRATVCDGLRWIGVELDEARNAAGAPVISRDGSAVRVRVIPTDEESVIARDTRGLLADRRPGG